MERVQSVIFSFANNAFPTLLSTNELFECMTNLRVVLMISEGSRVRVSFGSFRHEQKKLISCKGQSPTLYFRLNINI